MSQSKAYRKVKITKASLRLPSNITEQVVHSLRSHFRRVDRPAAHQIIVFPQLVTKDEDDENFIRAKVKLVIDWCGVKSHSVNVRCKINSDGIVLPSTMSYV